MKKVVLLSILLLLAITRVSFSHANHYEIELKTELISENDELASLKMTWVYDTDISDLMLQDESNLETLGKKMMTDLDLLGYFTQIKLNGQVLLLGEAQDSVLTKDNDALVLDFSLPLDVPVKISDKSVLSFTHEDPAEIAILYYYDNKQLILHNSLKKRCKKSVQDKKEFKEGEFPQIVKIAC